MVDDVIPAISRLYCSLFMNDIIMCNIGIVINLRCVILVFNIMDLLGGLITKRLLLIQAIGCDRLKSKRLLVGKRLPADILGQHVFFLWL